jgi:choline dehydrogenase-like flavoprotein
MIRWSDYRPDAPDETCWDVVIVGAGMGGSFAGCALARAGYKVLFLERGDPASTVARRAGRLARLLRPNVAAADLAARGRWNKRVTLRKGGRKTRFIMPLGSGPGGSSAIYGATLERFRREDFSGPAQEEVSPAPLPNRWPVSYDDFLPYYRRAEAQLGVRGERDPTDPDDDLDAASRSMPPPSELDRAFVEAFTAAGMAPFRMHMGIDYRPGCVECLGAVCPRDCKADGASRALMPALRSFGAKLLTGFAVDRLEANIDRVEGVVGRMGGREIVIRGRVVILAAGALNSPVVLLNSQSRDWPRGVGNANDMVGRGLMFHVLQIFALWPPVRGASPIGPKKVLSSRVANLFEGRKLGGVQSFARTVAPSQIAEFITSTAEKLLPIRPPFFDLAAMAIAVLAARLFRDASLFSAMTEDFAYHDNRIVADTTEPSGFSIVYTGTNDLSERAAMFRRFIKQRLGRLRLVFLSAGDNLNFGHPAGTCRMGVDPASSVVTPDGQVRGVENLFVADASFLPSSAATNPSLTVAANALRVADILVARLTVPESEAAAVSASGP